ncbi:LysR family transcriptional regulator [Paracoccus sp. R86501]|uniref:LysR family transcriptional regulator n=1 Tax=Paracoccus sp. R86501 TaxID=3101711 RepID=UPI00366F46EB
MLNAVWLETFAELCRTGHFTKTAQRLGMTQPGVSQHLRKLEAQVGHPLIIRQGKGFSLTAAGEAVLQLAQSRQDQERQLLQALQTDDPHQGEVRIACSGSFALPLMPALLPLMQQAPSLSIRLQAAPQGSVLQGLHDGQVDLGILGHDPAHPRLDARHLGQEQLCLVMPADHSATPSFDDLQRAGFIAHPDGFGYADDLFALNYPGDFTGAEDLHVRAFVNQIGQIPTPVAQGIGYTLLPRSGFQTHPDRGGLRIADLPHKRHHQLWLVSRRDRPMTARVQGVAHLIAQVAAGLALPDGTAMGHQDR